MKGKNNGKPLGKPKAATVLSVVLILISAATVIYYMLGPSKGYIHADCVDTMTWAQATIDSGKLFSPTFCYPYLLPFGATFLFYPFMLIFGFTMLAYRVTMLVFMLILGLAIYFSAKGLGWSRNLSLSSVAVVFLTVSSSSKLRELFWEHIIHYSLGTFLALTLLALTFGFLKYLESGGYSFKNNKKALFWGICIALWSFLSAFDGVTTLSLSSIPVAAGLIFVSVLDFKTKLFSKSNLNTFITVVIIIIATVLGTVALNSAAKGIGTGYGNTYSNIVNSGDWSSNMLKFLEQWTSLLGAEYEFGGAITKGKNILAAVKMAASLVIFAVPFLSLFIYKKLSKNERIFIIYHLVMTAFILYGYVFGSLSSVNWRLSPIICSALMVNIIVWRYLWNVVKNKRAAALTASLIVLGCIITLCNIWKMPADYGSDDDRQKAIALLEKNGLDYGYATYWNANVLTLLSSSRVKVRDVNIDEDMPRKGWLNSDNIWFEDQPGQDKYFFLLTNSEYEDVLERNHIILENVTDTIQEGNWVVLVMDRNLTFK